MENMTDGKHLSKKNDFMLNQNLNTTIYELQQLLYGYNYEVIFGVEIFNNCDNLEEFKVQLKKKFPGSKPESVTPIPVTTADLLDEIEFALDYRGDNAAGVQLSGSKLERFLHLKAFLLNFINESIHPDSKVYSYPDETGIPGYPVWWDYRFILFSGGRKALFIYGAASD